MAVVFVVVGSVVVVVVVVAVVVAVVVVGCPCCCCPCWCPSVSLLSGRVAGLVLLMNKLFFKTLLPKT